MELSAAKVSFNRLLALAAMLTLLFVVRGLTGSTSPDLGRDNQPAPPLPLHQASPTPSRQSSEFKEYSYTQLLMAMPLRLTVWADSEDQAQQACKAAFARAAELVDIFSDYEDASEVKRLLQAKPGVATSVSSELMTLLDFANELYRATDGAFDPTAGPVIRLWRQARKSNQLPERSKIQDVLRNVGFDKVRIDKENGTVTLLQDGIELDFGGIAKGFIGDQVLAVMREYGITTSFYRAGGDIVLGDAPPNSNGWTILLGSRNDGSTDKIELKNCAISTSGDTRQFIEVSGIRYSHIVDPRTGLGLTSERSVFVVAPSGIQSDALATAGCVLNENDFQNLLSQHPETTGWSK